MTGEPILPRLNSSSSSLIIINSSSILVAIIMEITITKIQRGVGWIISTANKGRRPNDICTIPGTPKSPFQRRAIETSAFLLILDLPIPQMRTITVDPV